MFGGQIILHNFSSFRFVDLFHGQHNVRLDCSAGSQDGHILAVGGVSYKDLPVIWLLEGGCELPFECWKVEPGLFGRESS